MSIENVFSLISFSSGSTMVLKTELRAESFFSKLSIQSGIFDVSPVFTGFRGFYQTGSILDSQLNRLD